MIGINLAAKIRNIVTDIELRKASLNSSLRSEGEYLMARTSAFLVAVLAIFSLSAAASTSPLDMTPAPTIRADAPSPYARRFEGRWKGQLGFEGSEQGKDEGFASNIGVDSTLQLRLMPSLQVRATPVAKFLSSRLQAKNPSDDFVSNQIYVDDFYLQYSPADVVEVRAGAIGQEFLDSPLLVDKHRAFPGGFEAFHFSFSENSRLSLIAQQLVPTSRSLNIERDSREPLPVFQTQTVHFEMQPTEDWSIGVFGGHYSWRNLPSKTAFYSQQIGNAPTSELPTNAKFRWGFDGFVGGAKTSYKFERDYGLELAFGRIINTAAPSDRRNAQTITVTPSYDQKFWKLELAYMYYFNESDTTPALYNPARLGNNNREGQAAQLKLNLKKYNFSIVGSYVQAEIINFDPNQQRLTYFGLGVETDYATF